MPAVEQWMFDVEGNFKSLECKSLIIMDKNNDAKKVYETTTIKGNTAYVDCIKLQHKQALLYTMQQSVIADYGKIPDTLCPQSVINFRLQTAHSLPKQ